MNTFNIIISEEQLNIIKSALEIQVEVKTFKEDTKIAEEENLLISMIEDIIEEGDQEITHGFCY